MLDPMMGSGTIPVLAAMAGHNAIGYDVDPLASLMAETWGRPLRRATYLESAYEVAAEARENEEVSFVAADQESAEFIERWFDPIARGRLAALAAEIGRQEPALQPALWCAFSRLIITKDAGASLARDVARPSTEELVLSLGDARSLTLDDDSIDAMTTSPPYLIAIDYLRGHRMSLVWMGYSIGELRELRASSIGAERSELEVADHEDLLRETLPDEASGRAFGVLRRYVTDLNAMIAEAARVLRTRGTATFVVADATLFGNPVAIPSLIDHLAHQHGLSLDQRTERALPADRRYLPPPTALGNSGLRKRMRHEVCLRYVAA